VGKTFVAFAAGIIMDLLAILVEHGLCPPSIFEAVEVDPDTRGMKESDLMKKIEDASVVDGVWHIKAYDM
jgi:hypothetical protein